LSIIVEYSTGINGLVLGETVRETDITARVERMYATDPERPFLFVWVTSPETVAVQSRMDRDPTVSGVQRLDVVGDHQLYRLRATAATDVVLYPVCVELGGQGLERYYKTNRCHFRTRFPDREALAAFKSFVTENGLAFELHTLYDGAEVATPPKNPDGLTNEQREALVLAYDQGLFDIPRRSTIRDLAGELGVSRQAVSERLRRGYDTLVRRHLKKPRG
jgi:predicted DNA binding protein